jgi:nitrogen-specific signal transduction histidine kinase
MFGPADSPPAPLANEAALAQQALEALQIAVALVDRNGAISLANGPCQRILARADGLVAREGRLACVQEQDAMSLERALRQTFTGCESAVAISRATQGRYSVCFMSLGADRCRSHCMVMIIDTDAAERANLTWRSVFDLSDAEVFLAKQLLSHRGH